MRRTVLAVALALLTSFWAAPASAQFGIKGGRNLSRFIGEDAYDETKTGLNFGGAFTLLGLGPVSVGPELYYAQKGGVREQNDVRHEIGLDYVEVPLLARLTLPGRILRPYVTGGPAYAWRLNCDVEREEGAAPPAGDECVAADFSNREAAVRTADRGLVLGGGLAVNVLNVGGVTLDARMVRGLARITEGQEGPDVKNHALSLMVGYSFGW